MHFLDPASCILIGWLDLPGNKFIRYQVGKISDFKLLQDLPKFDQNSGNQYTLNHLNLLALKGQLYHYFNSVKEKNIYINK